MAFALVLKVNRIWNFAQAGLMVVAYFAMFIAFRWLGLSPLPGAILGAITTILAAMALEYWGFRILRQRNSSVLTFFIFTIAMSQFLIYMAELIFGTDPKTLFPSIIAPVRFVGPVVVSDWDLIALSLTVTLVGALWLFLRKTREGKALIAVSDEPDLAEMYGMNKDRAYLVSMALAAILMSAGMYLIGTKAAIFPSTPLSQFMIFAVIATIIGGIGNIFAAGIAGIFLALLQSYSILVIASKWQILLLYILIFVVIILFPQGVKLKLGKRGPARKAGQLPPADDVAEKAS
ncbi:MAG: branched-chain amino acid ABC transporter permease [Beijerinckiaceae bacterium]|nr:branched-chain amino acid ABC transporter permease [Beijerinckiaceae bacterium]